MSIASRINEITEHLRNDWDSIDKLGLDITEENSNDNLDKNIENIAPVLDRFYNQASDKTDLAKNGIVGRTNQESTTGKNLLPTNASYWETGHYDSSSGEKTWFDTRMRVKKLVPISPSTTYYVSNALNKRLIIREYNANKEFIYNTGTIDSGNTFTTESNTYYLGISIEITYSEYNETASQLFMCNNNVVDKTYEPYTGGQPSPSPDYPQEINNLSGDVEYKVSGRNLFNKDSATLNQYLNSSGDIVTPTDNVWYLSDYILVSPNEQYTYKGLTFVGNAPYSAYYDENKNLVSTFKQAVGVNTITIPNNVYYIRFSIINRTVNNDFNLSTFMIEKGSTATTYEPYISESFPLNLGNIELCEIEPYKDKIARSTGKNLFDKSNIIENTYISREGGTGSSQVSNLSDYIKVKPNASYTLSYDYSALLNSTQRSIVYYDENNIYISGEEYRPENKTHTITTPNSTKYIRFSYDKSCYSIMLNEGNTALPYEPYGKVWYLNKQIGKVVLDGSESGWDEYTQSGVTNYYNNSLITFNTRNGLSNYFTLSTDASYTNTNTRLILFESQRGFGVFARQNLFGALANFKTWLSTHNTTVYYVLATPTNTEITEENYPTLYSQLLAIQEFLTKYKINKEFLLDYSSPEIEY